MPLPVTVVDAFAAGPFTGNPAAVVVTDGPLPERLMQQIALEMNHAETAFVVPRPAAGRFDLRWFTPTTEVKLCGHATLAAAFVLDKPDEITFHTRSGELHAQRQGAAVTLDFPRIDATPTTPPDIGVPGNAHEAGEDLLVEVADVPTLDALRPDLRRLAALPHRGLIATCRGTDGFDVASRFFAPAAGVDEDPATGSAHCALAPFWSARLNREKLQCQQRSRRVGVIETELVGHRVKLTGQAVVTLRGELLI
jgi:predicted PhzF superfamily epimerase YddE/YHI9